MGPCRASPPETLPIPPLIKKWLHTLPLSSRVHHIKPRENLPPSLPKVTIWPNKSIDGMESLPAWRGILSIEQSARAICQTHHQTLREWLITKTECCQGSRCRRGGASFHRQTPNQRAPPRSRQSRYATVGGGKEEMEARRDALSNHFVPMIHATARVKAS